jgi:hypothetical protein
MVHRENNGPTLKHAFPMNDTKMKKQSANKAAKMITKPVIEIHLTSKRISDLFSLNLWTAKSAGPFS